MSLARHLYTAAAYATLFEDLIHDGGTPTELTESSGLAINTARKMLMMLKRKKLIYVSSWQRDTAGRWTVPVYHLNTANKPDAKRPIKQTPTQRSAKYRHKKRAEKLRTLGINIGATHGSHQKNDVHHIERESVRVGA